MRELVLDTSLRDAAALVGLGHEALRKFVNGITEKPHQRSLRAMGQLYLQRRARGVAETPSAPTAGQLKLLFPPGLDAATAGITEMFDAWREGRPPPPIAAEVERWLRARMREEYAAEASWAPTRKRRRR